jgi:hypothetical protein
MDSIGWIRESWHGVTGAGSGTWLAWAAWVALAPGAIAQAASAREFATLNQQAHAATKLRTRADALAGIRAGIDGMPAEFGL